MRPTRDPLKRVVLATALPDQLRTFLYFAVAMASSLFRFALAATFHGALCFALVALELLLWLLFHLGALHTRDGAGVQVARAAYLSAISFGAYRSGERTEGDEAVWTGGVR